METTLVPPFPKSVNGAFKRFKGANLSESYRAWRDEASVMLVQQRPQKIAGRVTVEMLIRKVSWTLGTGGLKVAGTRLRRCSTHAAKHV